MKKTALNEILPLENAVLFGEGKTEISGVSYDSRTVEKGDIFFALPGHQTDGKKYIAQALSKGAAAIVSETKDENITVPQIVVSDIFHFMSLFSAKFYNYPDRELTVIGITGTNGKTTITYMIESIFVNSKIPCGVIGTVNYRYAEKIIEAKNTTPQSADIYKMMREMADNGIKYLAMEVSSHALSLGRVYGIDFDIAVFTNLTQDHLDFHKDINSYFEAKSLLFKGLGTGTKKNKKYAIINADDKYGKKLSKININSEIILYSAKKGNEADCKAENIEISSNESSFNISFKSNTAKISIQHIGLHNIYNALASFSACLCCGLSFENAVEGLKSAVQAPGRLERIDTKSLGFEAVVDYAHTDDALKNVLSALKALKPKRLITVFGCGGDRDRTKRPIMGKTAVEMSDFAFVTSDNPRTEDPKQITLDVEVGIKRAGKKNYKVVVDREEAIKEAVAMADKGDIVLFAGKGHETYQVIGTEKIHFNDIEMAEKYIEAKAAQKASVRQTGQKEFDF